MERARVWITTPWGMAYGSLPRQVEPRPVHFGEIIYEHCDLVIFDEADALMSVFDEVFAEVAELTNGKDGIYDRLGTQTERFSAGRRSDAGTHRLRWCQAQRSGQNASMALLTLLTDAETAFLHQWLERTQFTPHLLMVRLTRMMCGLTEFPRFGEEDSRDDQHAVAEAFAPFRWLFLKCADPLRQKHLTPDDKATDKRRAYHLWRILLEVAHGANLFSDTLLRDCQKWLTEVCPTLDANLAALNKKHKESGRDHQTEDKNRLAYRLLLTLAAALLDRDTNIVLYEWHSRAAPDEDDVEPHRRMPAILRDILPLPPIGRQFGTYFAPGDDTKRNKNRLSYLSYTNIGRWYLLRFHELFSDLDGKPGPHTFALSGTSYLPDSVRLHVGTRDSKPQGLLLPEEKAGRAISESAFHFLPLANRRGKAIRISGRVRGRNSRH